MDGSSAVATSLVGQSGEAAGVLVPIERAVDKLRMGKNTQEKRSWAYTER